MLHSSMHRHQVQLTTDSQKCHGRPKAPVRAPTQTAGKRSETGCPPVAGRVALPG
jgi:hypothetical protein